MGSNFLPCLMLTVFPSTGSLTTLVVSIPFQDFAAFCKMPGLVGSFLRSLPSITADDSMCSHKLLETMKLCREGLCAWEFSTGNCKDGWHRVSLCGPLTRLMFWEDYLQLHTEAAGAFQMNCLWNFLHISSPESFCNHHLYHHHLHSFVISSLLFGQ